MKKTRPAHDRIIVATGDRTTTRAVVGVKFRGWTSDDTDVPTGLRAVPENEANLPQPSRNPDPDPTDENEVERVLAEAAGLTKELEGEIGAEPPPAQPGVDLNPVTADPTKVDVDSELNRVEELLAEAQDTTGEQSAGPETDQSAQERRDAQDADQPAKSDPDHPQETTHPPNHQVNRGPDQPPTGEGYRPAAGEEDTTQATTGEVDAEPAKPETPDASEPSALTAAAESPAAAAKRSLRSRLHIPKFRSFREAVIPRGEEAVFGLVEWLVRMADMIDGLFTWISYDKRRIMGWVALALLVAACSITAFTLS